MRAKAGLTLTKAPSRFATATPTMLRSKISRWSSGDAGWPGKFIPRQYDS
jgi:hypothetical protein